MNHWDSTKDSIAMMLPLIGLYVLKQAPRIFLVLPLKLFVLAWIKNEAVIFGRAVWVISAARAPLPLRANPTPLRFCLASES